MKKIIFMAVLLTFSLSAAAQSYYGDDDVYDDYSYDISNDLDLTGEQWHTNEASILNILLSAALQDTVIHWAA